MSVRSALEDLYSRWRQWTESEADAINAAAWDQVARCQEAKRQLQVSIVSATEKLQAEAVRNGADWKEIERDFRAVVDQLIELETRNLTLLATQREAAKCEQERWDKAGLNVRQIQRAYSSGPRPVWHSYS